jgi:AmmeMemoRadiSam system protein B
LQRQLEGWLRQQPESVTERHEGVRAIIVPHAGYRYAHGNIVSAFGAQALTTHSLCIGFLVQLRVSPTNISGVARG